MIRVLTPTRDCPAGMRLVKHCLKKQTREFVWLIVDDGNAPISTGGFYGDVVASGEYEPSISYIRRKPSDKKNTHAENLLAGIESSVTLDDEVIIAEHDDWFGPRFVESHFAQLNKGYDAVAYAGTPLYHVPKRQWVDKRADPKWCLERSRNLYCYAFKGAAILVMKHVLNECIKAAYPYIDLAFFRELKRRNFEVKVYGGDQMIGLKGIPGRHVTWRHDRFKGKSDKNLRWLKSYVGEEDAERIVATCAESTV